MVNNARLDSTVGDSYTGKHSKHQSELTNSKILHSNSSMNMFENMRDSVPRNVFLEENTQKKVVFAHDSFGPSRQPSFGERTPSSQFVSPDSEATTCEMRVPNKNGVRRIKNKLSRIEAVSEFENS